MKKLIALLAVALSSVTVHAQGVWIEENIDPDTGLRTGVIEVNGSTYTIGPFANLSGARLENANLSGANLHRANLSSTVLSGANLSGANLTYADLNRVFLMRANLIRADLRYANLFRANLSMVNLSGANLNGADLSGFGSVSLSNTIWDTPDPRIAELEAQLAAAVAERDAAIQERDARYTEDQIRALSPNYTIGLNEAGNVKMQFKLFESADLATFTPLTVNPDSVSVVDGNICLEFAPTDNVAFFRFNVE